MDNFIIKAKLTKKQKFFLSIISGLLLGNAYSLSPIFILTWFSSIPVLILVYKSNIREAFVFGGMAGLIASLSLVVYLTDISNIVISLSLSVLRTLQWSIMLGCTSFIFRRFSSIFSFLFFPSIFASFDLIINLFSVHGSGGSVAYSQLNFIPIIQGASIGGTPYITFLLGLISSTIAYLICIKKKILIVTLVSFVIFLPLIVLNLKYKTEAKHLKIALLATDKYSGVSEEWKPIWEEYKASILDNNNEKIDIFLLPEKLFKIDSIEMELLLIEIQNLSKEINSSILIGLDERVGSKAYNRAYFVSPQEKYSYDKIHTIPVLESNFSKGSEYLIFDYKNIKIGISICKDMDFPQTIRNYSGIDLMLVPAWDFYNDKWFHSRMAVLRGVENGFSVARSAR